MVGRESSQREREKHSLIVFFWYVTKYLSYVLILYTYLEVFQFDSIELIVVVDSTKYNIVDINSTGVTRYL